MSRTGRSDWTLTHEVRSSLSLGHDRIGGMPLEGPVTPLEYWDKALEDCFPPRMQKSSYLCVCSIDTSSSELPVSNARKYVWHFMGSA